MAANDIIDLAPDELARLAALITPIAAGAPNEVALIQQVVREHLTLGPPAPVDDIWAFAGRHVRELLPKVLNDPRIEPVIKRFDALAAEQAPPESGPEILPAVAAGLAVGFGTVVGLGVAGYIIYCFTEPNPAPGESVEARCN
jgi:hypothetical protein